MRLAVLQPSYLPWLGYFDQIARSDVFVLYDDVQFDKHGWRNRNRIKTATGWQWLTVPVLHKGKDWPTNEHIRVNNDERWGKRHVAALRTNYAPAPYFDTYFPWLEEVLTRAWERLFDLNVTLIRGLCERLGITTRILRSSELGIRGERSERLLRICQALGARTYLSGDAARSYLDVAAFERHGIEVEWHEYPHPTYPQLFGDFVSHLSVVDLLFNCGAESRAILIKKDSDRSVTA